MDNNRAQLEDAIFSVLQWNCRSIFDKPTYVRDLVKRFHLICLQETWLEPGSPFLLDGNYTLARNDRCRGAGGTAIAVRKDVDYIHVNSSDNRDAPAFEGIEYTHIVVKNLNYRLNVFSLYKLPTAKLKENDWALFFEYTKSLQGKSLICGDYNAHDHLWSLKANEEGNQLAASIHETPYVILNNAEISTKIPRMDHAPCSPDVTLADEEVAAGASWHVTNDGFFSDHLPIEINITNCQLLEKTERYAINLRKVDWQRFADEITAGVAALDDNGTTAVEKYNLVTEEIKRCLLLCGAKIKKGKRRLLAKNKPWWNDECDMAARERSDALNAFLKYISLEEQIKLRRAEAIVKRTTKNAKRAYRRNWIATLNPRTPLKKIYNSLAALKNYQTSAVSVAQRDPSDPQLREMLDKLTAEPDEPRPMPDIPEVQNGVLDQDFTWSEYQQALKSQKINSAPGPDGLSNKVIRNLPEAVHKKILKIFNEIMNEGHFPTSWKEFAVLMMPKPGKKGYRPISLTQNMLKFLECLVKGRIEWYVESRHLLPDSQYGFRRGRSCYISAMNLASDVYLAFANRGLIGALFLDIEGAFNNVILELLVQEMIDAGFTPKYIRFVINLLRKRHLHFFFNGAHLRSGFSHKGVPQGSVLAPLLFNLYIRLLDKHIALCRNLQYADDCALSAFGRTQEEIKAKLEAALAQLMPWLKEKGLDVVVSKTQLVVFTRTRINTTNFTIQTPDGALIHTSPEASFLGITFDQKLTWLPHIKGVRLKALRALSLLKAIAGTSWGSHPRQMLKVYKGYIRATLDWGLPLYSNACESNKRLLEPVQNRALRLCLGLLGGTATATVLDMAGLPPLAIRAVNVTERFLLRCAAQTQDPLIGDLLKLHELNRKKKRRHMHFLLELLARTQPLINNMQRSELLEKFEFSIQSQLKNFKIDVELGDLERTENVSPDNTKKFEQKISTTSTRAMRGSTRTVRRATVARAPGYMTRDGNTLQVGLQVLSRGVRGLRDTAGLIAGGRRRKSCNNRGLPEGAGKDQPTAESDGLQGVL